MAARLLLSAFPTGITTQDPVFVYGLDITDKTTRVANFHRAAVRDCADLICAVSLLTQNTFVGILTIARRDPDYYHSNLNTLFLSFIADVLSRLLEDYRPDV